ncbi:hypothetical protein BU16DRAFT_454376 [Lophium mytilinum]|uniref:Uncharacterized protein n=1 Tax=Lophium mytilinum TaxID=390894 RepID=A0A6A6R609_9PEZI|nr:hypothetical protein BU16DRAFT_454376 [Lophium mytilinum]
MFQKRDWSKTCLGPITTWSHALRSNIFVIMNSPEQRVLLWGPDLALIYNDAVCHGMGKKHPSALGLPGSVGFAEGWRPLHRNIKEVLQTGRVKQVIDHYVPMGRSGLSPEETYFSYTLLPLIDENGNATGVLKELTETTRRVITERRQATIKKAEQMAAARNIAEFWNNVRNILESNAQDFPLALLYSFAGKTMLVDDSSRNRISRYCSLEGAVGITTDHDLASSRIELRKEGSGLEPHFEKALSTGSPLLLRKSDGSFPESLAIRIPDRGLGGTCASALVYPIRRLDGTGAIGFLLLGLNPQRPFDDDYSVFINTVIDHLVRAAASIIVPEEQKTLLRRTEIAESNERTFTKLAEIAPIGIAQFTPQCICIWRNDAYDYLSGMNGHSMSEAYDGWDAPIHPDDRPRSYAVFQTLLEKPHSITLELRVRRQEADGNGLGQWRWLLWHGSSEADAHGNLEVITSFLTDISDQKQVAKLQTQRLEDLLETKRQSENFIDMTCHEMRNPLSAMIQSADGIISAFELSNTSTPTSTQSAVIDAAQTIILCAQHQKRIVDDILTLSKLDSNLLLICPDNVQPIVLVENIIQMYRADLRGVDVTASLSIDQSFKNLAVGKVLLDPARLSQVLINLLTNAIKFTSTATERKITIIIGASLTQPTSGPTDVSYIPRVAHRLCSDPEGGEWGTGDEVFLQFDVVDTGRGLSPEEMKLLFLRFSQASPKTYAQYGGSGLGLFISRELTELQGGQIGVHSVAGQGSTFTFYIKARRYVPPTLALLKFSDSLRNSELASRDNLPATPPILSALNSRSGSVLFNVLLVEDNVINQKVLAQYLIREGCKVHVANHGVEALDFLARTTYTRSSSDQASQDSPPLPLDIILMDLEMPYMDGLTCVSRIRELQRDGTINSHIPVIAITANARKEQIANALDHGMDDVVTKPFRIPELIPKIADLVQRINAS